MILIKPMNPQGLEMFRNTTLLPLIKNENGQVKNGIKIIGFVFLLVVALLLTALLPLPKSLEAFTLIAAVLVVTWICLRLEKEPFPSIGLNFTPGFLIETLLGTLFGILLILLSALSIKAFGGFTWIRNPQVNLNTLFYALGQFLLVSLFEELLFRGYAFQRAVRGLGKTNALMLFGLFFVVAHWSNPGMAGSAKVWASLNIGLASVLLGLAWIKTESLALPIGIHLGWNWAQGSLLGFGVSGHTSQGFWTPLFNDLPQWFTGGDFGLEASLPGAIVCLIACIGLVFWKQKQSA